MEVVNSIEDMCELGRLWKSDPETTVVCVPTMGALHRGHGRLITRAHELGNLVVVTNFANPLQFDRPEDLKAYPRTPAEDRAVCEKMNVHYYFEPSAEAMFPPGFLTTANVAHLGTRIEGEVRPGHYRGVCTVVLKLFNIVQPDVAVFGRKDAQQLVIVRHMVRDLNLAVRIEGVPTVREKSGLAISSRNGRLTEEQKTKALCLSRALKRVHFLVKKQGITHSGELLQAMRSAINSAGEDVTMDYARIVSGYSLEDLSHVERGNTLLLVAATVGGVHLVDSSRL